MDALDKVRTYTGRETSVVEVREWAYVYWVRFNTGRPTLLSKKLVDRAASIRVAYTVAGDAWVKDEVTNQHYFVSFASPYEVGLSRISAFEAFKIKRCSKIDWKISYPTHAPKTLRELIVLKAFNCQDWGVNAA